MKKVVAIMLLSIHVFTVAGYRLAFLMAEKNANREMTTSLDEKNYNEFELLQIKLPLHLPYYHSAVYFERCDGNVEYNGVQYNYVKRMVRSDTLYLFCIPNKAKTDIINAKHLYAKHNADNNCDKSSQKSALKKNHHLLKYRSSMFGFVCSDDQSSVNRSYFLYNFVLLKGFTSSHLRPPGYLQTPRPFQIA